MLSRHLSRMVLLSWLLIGSQQLLAQNYTSSELPAPEWPDEWHIADMNGNGRLDLIRPHWTPDNGRELAIHLQQSDGRFPSDPSRTVSIRPEFIAVTTANVRPMPGKELILISNSAVYSYSTLLPGYEDNLERLFDWDLIASVPDRQRLLFLPEASDITGNGRPDLLLPGREAYGLFALQEDGSFELLHRFSTENEELEPEDLPLNTGRFDTEITINERDGLLVQIVPRSNSIFEDFLQDRRQQGQAQDSLLEFQHRLAGAVSARLRSSAGQDILFTDMGEDLRARVNILRTAARENGSAPERWQAAVNDEGDLQLIDFTGNGLMDLIRIEENDNDWDLYFYRNRDGQFNFDQADQVMRFSGYDLQVRGIDIDGDGRAELAVSYFTIPAAASIRNASINRVQLLFAAADDQPFSSRPASRNEERFSADAVRGLSAAIHLESDISGDGRKDALFLTSDGVLAASRIGSDLRLGSDPFWRHVPNRTITGFDVRDLNGNGQPDILLHHSTTTSILVSAP